MVSTIFIFIDGIGIGKNDPVSNPFIRYEFKTFKKLFGKIPHSDNSQLSKSGLFLKGIDATLGVPGIPQSGTGQTSIFAGINAQKLIGKHFGPFPHSTLIHYLKNKSLISEFHKRKLKIMFSNAYPKVFFDYLNKGKRRLGTIARMNYENNLRFNSVTSIRNGQALSSEIDNSIWVKRFGYKLPIIKASTAARRLLRISKKYELIIFEYFLSDHFGHGRNMEHFNYYFAVLDSFLFSLLTLLNKENTSIIICSDHGNLEDMSIKQHTLNPAIFLTAGKHAEKYHYEISRIDQIKDTILSTYN